MEEILSQVRDLNMLRLGKCLDVAKHISSLNVL